MFPKKLLVTWTDKVLYLHVVITFQGAAPPSALISLREVSSWHVCENVSWALTCFQQSYLKSSQCDRVGYLLWRVTAWKDFNRLCYLVLGSWQDSSLVWGKALKHHSAGAMSENAHHVAYMTNSHLYWHSYIVYLFLVAIFHCLTTVSKLSLGARCACMYPKFPEWYRRFYSKRALSNQIECVTRMVPCVMSPGFFLAFFHSFCLIIVFLFCFFSSNSQLWSLVGAFSAFRSMDLERLWFLTSLMRSLSE